MGEIDLNMDEVNANNNFNKRITLDDIFDIGGDRMGTDQKMTPLPMVHGLSRLNKSPMGALHGISIDDVYGISTHNISSIDKDTPLRHDGSNISLINSTIVQQ